MISAKRFPFLVIFHEPIPSLVIFDKSIKALVIFDELILTLAIFAKRPALVIFAKSIPINFFKPKPTHS